MKEWLRRRAENWRLTLIEIMGGYPDAESAIDAVDDLATRRKLLTLAVRRHFNTIGPDDILKVHEDKHTWLFQGKPLTEPEKNLLVAEARTFLVSKLWVILKNDIRHQANRKLFLLAKDEFDMIAGKMFIYALDCFETRLKSMEAGHGVFNSTPGKPKE